MANRFECYVRYCVPSERLFVICGSAVRGTLEGRESNTACGGPIEVVLLTETKHIPWVPVQIASEGKRPIKGEGIRTTTEETLSVGPVLASNYMQYDDESDVQKEDSIPRSI